eukprot:7391567-Prymnesium_polylepis.7
MLDHVRVHRPRQRKEGLAQRHALLHVAIVNARVDPVPDRVIMWHLARELRVASVGAQDLAHEA